jgi:short-subunit dehydrogenase
MKKKVLFVGASGAVASKLIPALSESYDIVGISRTKRDLSQHCVDFYTGDLFVQSDEIFTQVFDSREINSIIWNTVQYHPSPLLNTSRQALHAEFDLAVALPLECLRSAINHSFKDGTFLIITSLLAFGNKPTWGSYSMVKRAQVILAEYLAKELSDARIFPKAIALGSVSMIPSEVMHEAFINAIENNDPAKIIYKLNEATWS